jgi:hypothetical protein
MTHLTSCRRSNRPRDALCHQGFELGAEFLVFVAVAGGGGVAALGHRLIPAVFEVMAACLDGGPRRAAVQSLWLPAAGVVEDRVAVAGALEATCRTRRQDSWVEAALAVVAWLGALVGAVRQARPGAVFSEGLLNGCGGGFFAGYAVGRVGS